MLSFRCYALAQPRSVFLACFGMAIIVLVGCASKSTPDSTPPEVYRAITNAFSPGFLDDQRRRTIFFTTQYYQEINKQGSGYVHPYLNDLIAAQKYAVQVQLGGTNLGILSISSSGNGLAPTEVKDGSRRNYVSRQWIDKPDSRYQTRPALSNASLIYNITYVQTCNGAINYSPCQTGQSLGLAPLLTIRLTPNSFPPSHGQVYQTDILSTYQNKTLRTPISLIFVDRNRCDVGLIVNPLKAQAGSTLSIGYTYRGCHSVSVRIGNTVVHTAAVGPDVASAELPATADIYNYPIPSGPPRTLTITGRDALGDVKTSTLMIGDSAYRPPQPLGVGASSTVNASSPSTSESQRACPSNEGDAQGNPLPYKFSYACSNITGVPPWPPVTAYGCTESAARAVARSTLLNEGCYLLNLSGPPVGSPTPGGSVIPTTPVQPSCTPTNWKVCVTCTTPNTGAVNKYDFTESACTVADAITKSRARFPTQNCPGVTGPCSGAP